MAIRPALPKVEIITNPIEEQLAQVLGIKEAYAAMDERRAVKSLVNL